MTKVLQKDSTLTAKQVAAAVTRKVNVVDKAGKIVLDADNNPVTTDGAVKADEVMSFAEYPDRDEIVVVTTSGEKLTGKLSDIKADAKK